MKQNQQHETKLSPLHLFLAMYLDLRTLWQWFHSK